jgi:formylglycine-generating enzyme required for sulfatase activity
MRRGDFTWRLVLWTALAAAQVAFMGRAAVSIKVEPRPTHLRLVVQSPGQAGMVQTSTDLLDWQPWALFPACSSNLTHFLESTNLRPGPVFFRVLGTNLTMPMGFQYVAPGEFLMGSPLTEAGRAVQEFQHVARVQRGFWMNRYEVTVREWVALMGSDANHSVPTVPDDSDVAMSNISWMEAMEFCRRYTYQEMGAGRLPAPMHYRLPTESEWEYAARAGTTTRFYYGDDPAYADLGDYAWYGDNGGQPHPCGLKRPNAWGLYDMLGNVFEWCLDPETAYPGSDYTPTRARIYRGGSYYCPKDVLRCAHRTHVAPMDKVVTLAGLRLVLACEPDSLRSVEELADPEVAVAWTPDHTEAHISLGIANVGATLYYTTDLVGYFPEFTAYTEPIAVRTAGGIKAKALKPTAVSSDVIRFDWAQAQTPTVLDLGVMLRLSTDEPGTTIEWRWDDDPWQDYVNPLAWEFNRRFQARGRHPDKLTSAVVELEHPG